MIELIGVPDGIRTRVIAVKGRCPRPLDDGDAIELEAPRFDNAPRSGYLGWVAVSKFLPRLVEHPQA